MDAFVESLATSLDNYELSGVDTTMLTDKHKILERASTTLEHCARLCIHGSGRSIIG